MLTQELAKEESEIASAVQGRVLAALSAVPLDKARLIQVVLRHTRSGRWSHRLGPADKSSVGIFDTLAILQADGLIRRTAHPLEARRIYYLTEKGSEAAKGVVLERHRKVPPARPLRPAGRVGS